MLKIVALNEEIDSNSDDEIKVSKEAEETIAISEYMRALSFKAQNEINNAMNLFTELLETKVLNELLPQNKDEKLYFVKYNCYKNIAYILEERKEFEKALEHYMKAIHLDDTDVFMMNRMGQLSLKCEKWEQAEYAFQKCLLKNPNYWPAADGVLQCLCKTRNIMGAYGWALKWYQKDKTYNRAEDVLIEITETFPGCLPLFEKIWPTPFVQRSKYKTKKQTSVFATMKIEINEQPEKFIKPNLEEFKINKLNWKSVGKYILKVYNHLVENKQSLFFLLSFDDICPSDQKIYANRNTEAAEEDLNLIKENDKMENCDQDQQIKITQDENMKAEITEPTNEISAPSSVEPNIDQQAVESPSQTIDESIDDHENGSNSNQATPEIIKEIKKPRRRCSDLSYLEQWGWHKNKRYSSRKKSQQEKIENDTSIKSYLKRMFPNDFDENFDNQSPFLADDRKSEELLLSKKQEEYGEFLRKQSLNFEDFQTKTELEFKNFQKEVEEENFELLDLLYMWLKYISKFWEDTITDEIKNLYYEIYQLYLNHYDLQTWNMLSNNGFNSAFRMALMYLELALEKDIEKSKSSGKNVTLDSEWRRLFLHLNFQSGIAYVFSDDMYNKNIIRLLWLDFCSSKLENNWNKCVECLQILENFLLEHKEEIPVLKLPNLKQNNYIDLESIKSTCSEIQRRISLINVKNLYDSQNYKELCEILKESLVYSSEIRNSDDTMVLKVQTQLEILLESLWNSGQFDDCMIWSERCLFYAVKNLLDAPTDTYRYQEWAKSCNFILIYLEELVFLNTREILNSIDKYISRLVQSISKILIHQFDAPFNKNNNPNHMVNCKRTWVILHQILLKREENQQIYGVTTKSSETINNETGVVESEMIPLTFAFLFTAHECLGRRLWCTRDDGEFLLYILNFFIPKIRLPLYDSIREQVVEYIEQLTYCLFGYPPKKARSKHIEEHDAKHIQLTFKLAIQIFDFYRPEILPEFNSYKLDSISSDFETLLLKILLLIPKDCDPSEHSDKIRDFIDGKSDYLPIEGFDKLPFRIKCIYYLLGDFYFKNRDLQKSIKYFVLDLTCEPKRFDSWAGVALSKQSRLDTKLNSCTFIDFKECLDDAESTKRCFEQCININKSNTLLWIEYGQFSYTIHSFCSRILKHCMTISMDQFSFVERVKEVYLETAEKCFKTADKTIKDKKTTEDYDDDEESHDEKWLHHFMLGKIAEKRKEHPKIYLDHYLMAANLLHESNATYPIKINHNNPSTLSIEALEVFYRTTSAVIKYLEQNKEVKREIGKLFQQVLKELAGSPFAYNQAKINDSSINAFKRKLAAEKAQALAKKQRIESNIELTSGANVIPPTTVLTDVKELPIDSNKESPIDSIEESPIDSSKEPLITLETYERGLFKEELETNSSESEAALKEKEASNIAGDAISNNYKDAKIENNQHSEKVENPSTKTSENPVHEAKKSSDSEQDSKITTTDDNLNDKNEKFDMEFGKKTESLEVEQAKTPIPESIPIQPSDSGSPSRRESQESSAGTTTSTTGTSSSSSSSESSSSSSDSSSEDSESASTEDENEKYNENEPFTFAELEPIYKSCVKNLEECVTRFPEHYKSIYRLVHHYLNAPEKLQNMDKCHQLLLASYTTSLGTQITGLFTERKNNNFFNGLWRIPSSEIDRPGSFSTHLVKCVNILLEVLRKAGGHSILIEMALQLHRTPDPDKRYIGDFERKELYKQALASCVQVMRDILKKNQESRNDNEIIELLLDIYKAHKKCIKHMNQKEALFSQLLVDTYKLYMNDKVRGFPNSVNLIDVAIRFCVQEISRRKTGVKRPSCESQSAGGDYLTLTDLLQPPGFESSLFTTSTSINELKSLPQRSNTTITLSASSTATTSTLTQQQLNSINMFNQNMATAAIGQKLSMDPKFMNNFFNEFYKFLGSSSKQIPPISTTSATTQNNVPFSSANLNQLSNQADLNSAESTLFIKKEKVNINPFSYNLTQQSMKSNSSSATKLPQFDIKNLIASAASQVAQTTQSSSATITLGGGELTITPAIPKPSVAVSVKPINELTSASITSLAVSGTKQSQPQKSPGLISVKPLSDLTDPLKVSTNSTKTIPKIPNLPDLPKSLTITPSGLSQDIKLLQPLSSSKIKTSGKVKSTKRTTTARGDFSHYPYAKYAATANAFSKGSSDLLLNQLTTAVPSLPLGSSSSSFNTVPYAQQTSLLYAYADMLKQAGIESNKDLLSQITKAHDTAMLPDSTTSKKQTSKSSKSTNYQKPTSTSRGISLLTQPIISPNSIELPSPSAVNTLNTITKSSQGTTIPKYPSVVTNQPLGGTSQPFRAQSFADAFLASLPATTNPLIGFNASGRMTSQGTSSLSTSATQISPTKTLQQKLAEQKLKANQMMAQNSPSGNNNVTKSKKPDVDVIILD